MKKVLLTKPLTEELLSLFKETDASLVHIPEGDMDAFSCEIKDSNAVLLSTSFKLGAELIDTAHNLGVISRTGVGVDNVDIDAATKKGILVLNTPDANTISVAEHTVALIAGISKQLVLYDSELRKDNFRIRRRNLCVDIEGKTLGLVGCGRIGRMVAKKCSDAFNMRVIGYDPCFTSDIDNIKIFTNIEDVFENADYISLHIPLTESTKNLVGEKLLSLMKPEAYLINTARGGIIDEDILAQKLKNNSIEGAALDVFSSEPPKADNPLTGLPNIILTPHSAALTKECANRISCQAVRGIVDFLCGRTPQFIFNKEMLKLNQ